MAKFNFILTADYEVFGNGSGDVRTCMIAPTKKLLDICDAAGAKVTLFVDVCELWAFLQVEKAGHWDMSYSAYDLIVAQILDAIKRGHDVQLHFHPQWLDYTYLGEGKWNLNHEKWRLPNLSENEIDELFKRGKNTLEELILPIRTNYKCNVFRAGGWCIQPEEMILKAMRKHGFNIESSVAAGVYNPNEKSFFDFRNTPDLPYWKISESVTTAAKGDIFEIPIYTAQVPWQKTAMFLAKRFSKKVPLKPQGCVGYAETSAKKSKWQKGLELLKADRKMFNFTDATTAAEMKWFAKNAMAKYAHFPDVIPIVMIGHPKTFGNANELKEFLFWATDFEEINFTDYNSYLDER